MYKPVYYKYKEYEEQMMKELSLIGKFKGLKHVIELLENEPISTSGYRGHHYQADVILLGIIKGLKLAERIQT